MAITAVSFSTGASASATVSAPAPTGVVAGDLLFIWMIDAAASITFSVTAGSTGWTVVTATSGQNASSQFLYKYADATDVTLSGSSGNYTVTSSTSHTNAGIIAHAPGYAFDVVPTTSGNLLASVATSYAVTGITTVTNGDTLLLFGGSRIASGAPGAMTLPGGWSTVVSELDTTSGSVANVGVILGTKAQATAGATGTATISLASSEDGGGLMVALRASSWARVQSAVTAATSSAISSVAVTYTQANVSSGTKLIAVVSTTTQSGTTDTTASVKDGASNNFTLIGHQHWPTSGNILVDVSLWAIDTPVGDVGTKPTITATLSGGTCNMAILVQEVSGLAVGNTTAAMVDGTAGSLGGVGASGSTGSPTYVSSIANEYMVSIYGDDGGPLTWTKPTALVTDTNSLNTQTWANVALAYGYSTGGTEAGSWAITGSSADWSTVLVAFKSAITAANATKYPLPGPVGLAGNRITPPLAGRVGGIQHGGVYNQVGPPLRPQSGPPPGTDPVKAPANSTPFRKGSVQSRAGWRSFTLFNTFEGQSSGTAVTTGNSSGGDGSSAFDVTSVPSGGTLAYDNSEIAHGTESNKLATAATAGTPYVGWSSKLGPAQPVLWFRLYLYFTAFPSATQRIVEALQNTSAVGGITIDTTGLLHSVDASGANRTTSTNTIPLNKWFRVEGFIAGSPNEGQVEFKLFEGMDAVLPLETQTSAGTLNTLGPITVVRFGHGAGSSIANLGPWWQDDIGVSNTGYMGPTLFSGPPVYPLQGPIRSRLPGPFRKGRNQSNPGVYDGVGPPVKPLPGPIRSRLPGPFRKGRTQNTPPYVAPYVIIPVAPPPPKQGPAGIAWRAPGPFRKGRVQSSPGVREQTGPKLTPLRGPVRSRILQTFSKGRTEHNAGKYNQVGPPLTPLQWPVRAVRPGPYRKGQVQNEVGVFNGVGPKLKALAGPIRARLPGPFRKGRTGSNKGAPVFIPPPTPSPLPHLHPARTQLTRFGAKLAQSRRRRWDPAWPQRPLTQPFPTFITQRGKHPRAYLRLLPSARRRFREAWGQGNQGSAWPTGPRRTSPKPRLGARLRRGRFFIPTPPQGNKGVPNFAFIKARPRRLVRTAVRSRVFRGWPQGNQGQAFPTPPKYAGKRPRAALRLIQSRRRRFDFPMGQANRGSAYPTYRQPSHDHRRFAARLIQSRRRQWSPVPPQANRGQAFPSYIRGKGPKIRLLARLRQSRQRRWLATHDHVTSSQTFTWNVEKHLTAAKQFNWNVLSHVVSSIAIEWNVGITVQSRPRLMTMEGWEQGMNAARLMTEEGRGYMGGGE